MPDPSEELDELRALAAQVRAEKVEWETPPADLWSRIAAEADLDTTSGATDPALPTTPTPQADTDGGGTSGRADASLDTTSGAAGPPTVSAEIRPAATDAGPPTVSATIVPSAPAATGEESGPYDTAHVGAELTDPGATVHSFEAARARRGVPRWLLAAAAVVVVLGLGGVLLRLVTADDGPAVLAASPLARLGDAGEGRAELIEEDGSLQLRVEASGIEPGDEGFLEVWVIDRGVSKLISLGPVRSDGLYDLPDSYDAQEYPIVDVSIEPNDGDPTHSGNSVLRGELTS